MDGQSDFYTGAMYGVLRKRMHREDGGSSMAA